METDPQFEPAPAERFVDAALREKAHLGEAGRDSELVHRILQETVHRPEVAVGTGMRIASSRLDPKLILSGVAAVAALVSLALVALNALPFNSNRDTREEYHFVVQSAQPLVGSFHEELIPPVPRIEPSRHTTHLTFSSPGSSTDLADTDVSGPFDLPLKFESSFDSLPEKPLRYDRFTISAEDSRAEGNRIVFSGDVLILHNEFRIEADSAIVVLSKDKEQPLEAVVKNVKVFHFASGSTATAGFAGFDPSTGVLELSAVHTVRGNHYADHDWTGGDNLVFAEGRLSVVPVSTAVFAAPLLENR